MVAQLTPVAKSTTLLRSEDAGTRVSSSSTGQLSEQTLAALKSESHLSGELLILFRQKAVACGEGNLY